MLKFHSETSPRCVWHRYVPIDGIYSKHCTWIWGLWRRHPALARWLRTENIFMHPRLFIYPLADKTGSYLFHSKKPKTPQKFAQSLQDQAPGYRAMRGWGQQHLADSTRKNDEPPSSPDCNQVDNFRSCTFNKVLHNIAQVPEAPVKAGAVNWQVVWASIANIWRLCCQRQEGALRETKCRLIYLCSSRHWAQCRLYSFQNKDARRFFCRLQCNRISAGKNPNYHGCSRYFGLDDLKDCRTETSWACPSWYAAQRDILEHFDADEVASHGLQSCSTNIVEVLKHCMFSCVSLASWLFSGNVCLHVLGDFNMLTLSPPSPKASSIIFCPVRCRTQHLWRSCSTLRTGPAWKEKSKCTVYNYIYSANSANLGKSHSILDSWMTLKSVPCIPALFWRSLWVILHEQHNVLGTRKLRARPCSLYNTSTPMRRPKRLGLTERFSGESGRVVSDFLTCNTGCHLHLLGDASRSPWTECKVCMMRSTKWAPSFLSFN